MDHALKVFGSVTVANRAKKLMQKQTDYAAVVQLPPDLGIRGCSYCLRIKLHDFNLMRQTAAQYGIQIKAAFAEGEIDGQKVYESI